MKLSELFDCTSDVLVTGLADDSRNVEPGYVFVATKGYYADHFDYIADAINRGACCVVTDRKVEVDVLNFVVENINDYYIKLCEKFFNVSPSEFKLIGVTGTDGKTTTTTIIKNIFEDEDLWAVIGTNGVIVNGKHYSTNNTTPCVFELYKALAYIKREKCQNIVMEVSSEALLHDRLKSFKFDAVIYTNITEDHLNIHKTIDNYRKCKFKLLDLVKQNGVVLINGDDENCKMIDRNDIYTIGVNKDNVFTITDVKETANNVKFVIVEKDNNYQISSPLIGIYNVYNVAMAFAIGILMKYNSETLQKRISQLGPVNGRGEYLDFGQDFSIVLDYAHTYNGIKNILDSVSQYKKIIVVTGAAGGREKEKRRKIGQLILDRASLAIFTMDDPRYESVDEIIDQMVGDTQINYLRIVDRENAIFKALSSADKDSIVLILGKGRDNYMAIENRKEPYCDYDVICEYFKKGTKALGN